ncbi:hypothetical protein AB0N71_18785, partial [Pseudarthrobacter enclensis]|uniref:hypothetical protein n=1 Tax=Pseudarthrobacter enclensis TaxID=993070 RepID=UPI00344773D3
CPKIPAATGQSPAARGQTNMPHPVISNLPLTDVSGKDIRTVGVLDGIEMRFELRSSRQIGSQSAGAEELVKSFGQLSYCHSPFGCIRCARLFAGTQNDERHANSGHQKSG